MSMTCDRPAEEMVAWLDGELPADARAAFEQHLAECAACRERVQQFQQTGSLLAGSAVPVDEAALVRSIRSKMNTAPASVSPTVADRTPVEPAPLIAAGGFYKGAPIPDPPDRWEWLRESAKFMGAAVAFWLVAAVLILVFRDSRDGAEHSAGQPAATPHSQIVFSANLHNDDPDSGAKIFGINPDGSGITKILPGPAQGDPSNESQPAWSPDGRMLAYVSDRDGSDDIWVWDGAGEPVKITSSAVQQDSLLEWSSDSTRIAFVSGAFVPDNPANIYTVRSDGRDLQQLTKLSGGAVDPQWSRDDSSILFIAIGAGTKSAIWVMDANGQNQRMIAEAALSGVQPTWSPDGRQIAFSAFGGNIYVVNADGSDLRALTPDGFGAGSPVWSPDASQIAFTRSVAATGEAGLYVIHADGTDLRSLVNVAVGGVAWSPDGSQLAYTTGDPPARALVPRHPIGGTMSLHVINADGTGDREILDSKLSGYTLRWRTTTDTPLPDTNPTASPPPSWVPAATPGDEIALPPNVSHVPSSNSTIRLVAVSEPPIIQKEDAMAVVMQQIPWGLGGTWEGKEVTIDAWYGLATVEDGGLNPMQNRLAWILDYGNVQGIMGSGCPGCAPPPDYNHDVYAVDAQTRELRFVGSYGEFPYPSPTPGPPMQLDLPDEVAHIAETGVSIKMYQATYPFTVSYDQARQIVEQQYPRDSGYTDLQTWTGIATVTGLEGRNTDVPLYLFDDRKLLEQSCPASGCGFLNYDHRVYGVDGDTGALRVFGTYRETHAIEIEQGSVTDDGTPMTDATVCDISVGPPEVAERIRNRDSWDVAEDAPGQPAPIVLRSGDQQQEGRTGRWCFSVDRHFDGHALQAVSFPGDPITLPINPSVQIDLTVLGTPSAISISVYDLTQAQAAGKIVEGNALLWPYSPPAVPMATCCMVFQQFFDPSATITANLPLPAGDYVVLVVANFGTEREPGYTEQGFHVSVQ